MTGQYQRRWAEKAGTSGRACPKCGGTDVRAMSHHQTVAFYGDDRFVVTPPRRCRGCGHGFELPPSAARGWATVTVGVFGLVVVAAMAAGWLVVLGMQLSTGQLLPEDRPWRGVVFLICGPAFLGGAVCSLCRLIGRGRREVGRAVPPPV